MKTSIKKAVYVAGFAAVAAAVLAACTTTTLEQQIAVKEPGSWDFAVKDASRGMEYIRIYDSPGKVGWFKYEYGQKSPCNQGFQKAIKTVAPGLVAYTNDPNAKSFACDVKLRYIFRTDANGHPYEGWAVKEIKDREKRDFVDISVVVAYWDNTNVKPSYIKIK